MTFFEYTSAMNGWAKANGAIEKASAPTDEEFYAAITAARH